MTNEARPIGSFALDPILRLANAFAHADPVGWNPSVPRSMLSIALRHIGNQFPYVISTAGKWGRSQILYNELPTELAGARNTPAFDFHGRFEALTCATVADFIDIGFLAFAAATGSNLLGFTRGYFEKARLDGLTLGHDEVVRAVLKNIAADSAEHARISIELQQPQRDFAAYDFSSLMEFPLIRPWPGGDAGQVDSDRMIAPIPDLILYRITSGIYYHMRHRWKDEFDRYFGHLLNAYVGRLLKGFVTLGNLISEEEMRRTYPSRSGKVPDWIIVDGKTAILVEVKVARIQRVVYATGREDKLSDCLDAVRGGLIQLCEFQSAVTRRAPGLERLARCREFLNIIITLEPMYLWRSDPFKNLVREGLPDSARRIDWSILSLDDIEWAQVHLCGGTIDVASFFRHMLTASWNDVIKAAHEISKGTFGNSILFEKEQELYDRLGVSRALGEGKNVT
ncbi:MAG: hypothetical protein ABSB42_04550 [Tepidisphaeraceae bacterium]|jgi:hypothetical protein